MQRLTSLITALIAGLIFGFGLILSGMTDPAKVLGFLDLAGQWDPSLILVMGGAIAVATPAFMIAKRRAAKQQQSLLGEPLRLPTSRNIESTLVLGALCFGVGWGIAGYCPGPALASLASGSVPALIFSIAMLAGMALFTLIQRYRHRS